MMNTNQIPRTESELAEWMKANCYNFDNYSIGGNIIHEGYGIDRAGGHFTWYYTERGRPDAIKTFPTEKEIIAYAYQQIQSDQWANAHCIGFTTHQNDVIELTEKLNALNLKFKQDQIPYYGPQQPAYRVFVFGCDHQKVLDLKAQYHQER